LERRELRALADLPALGVLGLRLDGVLRLRRQVAGGLPDLAPLGELPLDRFAVFVLDVHLDEFTLGGGHLQRVLGADALLAVLRGYLDAGLRLLRLGVRPAGGLASGAPAGRQHQQEYDGERDEPYR